MISFVKPSDDAIVGLQQQQQSFYWSACAELFFRKQGLFLGGSCAGTEDEIYAIALRETGCLPKVGFVEGPLDIESQAQLGLQVAESTLSQVDILDAAFAPVGSLVYGRFLVKKIPENREELTVPHEHLDDDPRWHAKDIRFQYFKHVPNGWRILAYASIAEGNRVPVVVANNSLIVCGISVFDIFGFNHAMPALSEGFYKSILGTYQYPLECWLVSQITAHASAAGFPLERKALWPQGSHAALTIRHDYDRTISRERLDDMLRFYAERNIRATWFILVDKPPPPDQINAMLALGHEVALHTISPDLNVFLKEVVRFREITGVTAAGFTCHGGIGSRGHLALTHNQWAINASMRYGEMIGRCRGVPHPLVLPRQGYPGVGKLLVQNCHHSLDLTTKPDGHQLEKLRLDVPKALEEGGHVTIMNHPDIHWQELISLLDGLTLDGVWCAPIADVVERLSVHAYS